MRSGTVQKNLKAQFLIFCIFFSSLILSWCLLPLQPNLVHFSVVIVLIFVIRIFWCQVEAKGRGMEGVTRDSLLHKSHCVTPWGGKRWKATTLLKGQLVQFTNAPIFRLLFPLPPGPYHATPGNNTASQGTLHFRCNLNSLSPQSIYSIHYVCN